MSPTNELDLEGLRIKKVITPETYEWLNPLHDQEITDLDEIRAAALERQNNPFYNVGDDDDDDDDDGCGGLSTTETSTLHNIEGTNLSVSFAADINSTGHGNKIWHASIATCRYLKEQYLLSLFSEEKMSSSLLSLELGAGTAVPSLFLAKMLLDGETTTCPQKHIKDAILRITDAREYRNIVQILRSVEFLGLSPSSSSSNNNESPVGVEVHPHNWGDNDDFFGIKEARQQQQQHDLVIVSDCIYNPDYHDQLLVSLAKTLAIPDGKAVVSFSLHGNVDDGAIWEFIEKKLPSKTKLRTATSGEGEGDVLWRLEARCVSLKDEDHHSKQQPVAVREGWNMEATMNELGMVIEGLKPERWLAYVYEVTWTRD